MKGRFAHHIQTHTFTTLALLVCACGGGIVKDPEPEGGPNGSGSGSTSSTDPAGGGDLGTGGTGSGTGTGSAGSGDPGTDPTGAGGTQTTDPDVPVEVDPDFPGVDVGLTPDEPPAGCLGGFDAGNGSLTLTLNTDVAGALVNVQDGTVMVNDTQCTDADDVALAIDRVQQLRITGGSERNVVILDFSMESWGDLASTPEAITLDLGAGTDDLLIRGTDQADAFTHGATASALVLDLSGDLRADVVASGVSRFTVSLGPGDDRLSSYALVGALPTQAILSGVGTLAIPMSVLGAEGDDDLTAGNGNDLLDGGDGADVLNGSGGDDVFDAGAHDDGPDLINGGDGFDEVSYAKRVGDLVVSLCMSAATIGCDAGSCDCEANDGEAGESDNLVNIDAVTGGAGDDYLEGSTGDDAFFGGYGNDELIGGLGSDVLLGQEGVDIIEGGLDVDICDGQPGEIVTDCEI